MAYLQWNPESWNIAFGGLVLGSLILYLKGMRIMMFQLSGFYDTENPIKLETGLRPNSAGIPYTVLLRIEAIGFPTFGLLP